MQGARRYKQKAVLAEGHTKGITAVAFSAEGTYIATGGLDGRVCIWHVEDAKLLYRYSGSSPALSLAWVPVGEETLLFGTRDGNVGMLTISLALNDFSLSGFWAHKYPVEHLAIVGNYVASGAHKEVKVWQWLSLEQRFAPVHVLDPPPKTSHNEHQEVLVTSLHWTGDSPELPLLMVTYMHHGVQLYEAARWRSIRTISLQGKIARASLSPDGSLLAVANVERGFDIYRTDTEQPVGLIPHDVGNRQPTPVLFIHNGQALVCGSSVGNVEIWDMKLGKLHSLVISGQARVLALSAHSQPMPNSAPYRFRIATGIYTQDSPSVCVIWEAQQLETKASHDAGAESDPQQSPATPGSDIERRRVSSWFTKGLKGIFAFAFVAVLAYCILLIPVPEDVGGGYASD